MKNIKKMDPKLKEETVNEIVKKENNKEKRRNLKLKCTFVKEKRDGIKYPLNKYIKKIDVLE